ncbi:MAG: hypothetical protein A3J00_02280 [Candidatus Niyogibacteria bacterium RIFCSPLOWO2_02_FULL_45_13]|uniref:ABC transporter ATP-binding protein n=1 Tax=Candidatus Niyogibacteria bacterium RIFCSPLOWO2_02_FULL_45_13 TaxID=1801725 RepID=A0A1G2F057_9BACT|nr:MAG: hypothetical protein A3J00_02280 [Candidatus Niyogibacteria bacterium RIFCSPLOWO2_02_FULL_45_13]
MFSEINKIKRAILIVKSAFGEYRYQIFTLGILNLLGGVFEVVGINAIIPIFSIVVGGGATDPVSRAIERFFSYFHISYTVKYLIIFIVLMFVVKAAALFISKYISIKISADYEENTRSDLFKAMTKSGWPYLARQKAGYLDQILITDIRNSSVLLVHIGNAILIMTNLLVYGFLALNVSFVIAILAFILGGSVVLIFRPLFYKNALAYTEMVEKYKELSHFTSQIVSGMKAVKSSLAEEPVFQRSLKYFRRMKELSIRVNIFRSFSNVALQPIAIFFVLGIFAVFYKTQMFNFASFAVIVYAINRVFSNIDAIQTEIHIMVASVPHVRSILDYKKEADQNREKSEGSKLFKFEESLEFKNVGFSYLPAGQTLSDINFSISRGCMTGLIGPSGAGKSTLVDLLLRLLCPQNGVILADGENISNISLPEWRRNIAYVPQEPFLINDTIYNNITFFNPSLTAQDVEHASRTANIYDFIVSLPNGLETVVGERGLRLSGGERQRVVLARAIARNPQILILDEATSSLDNESELAIQKAIERLKGKMTIIIIAHRLSTVENSDKLIVLEGGVIRETGTPEELLKDKESYFFKTYNLRR